MTICIQHFAQIAPVVSLVITLFKAVLLYIISRPHDIGASFAFTSQFCTSAI